MLIKNGRVIDPESGFDGLADWIETYFDWVVLYSPWEPA